MIFLPARKMPEQTLEIGKIKGTFRPITCHEGTDGEQKYSYFISLTSALAEGEKLRQRHSNFTPRNDPVPSVNEAGWAPRSD